MIGSDYLGIWSCASISKNGVLVYKTLERYLRQRGKRDEVVQVEIETTQSLGDKTTMMISWGASGLLRLLPQLVSIFWASDVRFESRS
jgi:hypothetical protein